MLMTCYRLTLKWAIFPCGKFLVNLCLAATSHWQTFTIIHKMPSTAVWTHPNRIYWTCNLTGMAPLYISPVNFSDIKDHEASALFVQNSSYDVCCEASNPTSLKVIPIPQIYMQHRSNREGDEMGKKWRKEPDTNNKNDAERTPPWWCHHQ